MMSMSFLRTLQTRSILNATSLTAFPRSNKFLSSRYFSNPFEAVLPKEDAYLQMNKEGPTDCPAAADPHRDSALTKSQEEDELNRRIWRETRGRPRLNPIVYSKQITEGPEITNFSEKTLRWILHSMESHMDSNSGKYEFGKDDIQMLSDEKGMMKTLVSCTAQNTSTYITNRMLSDSHFVHSFTRKDDFYPLRTLFNIKAMPSKKDGVSTLKDMKRNICIEQMDIDKLGMEWMVKKGYGECFDVIFDELALDTVVERDAHSWIDPEREYIQTTIFGHCLKRAGVLYVSSPRMSRDISGSKLRQKIGSLYGNSHFEMVGERDTAWHTQFLFLKTESCSNSTQRDSVRKDHWGDGHFEYNQNKIWNRNEVTENAGMDMREGVERVFDAVTNFHRGHNAKKYEDTKKHDERPAPEPGMYSL